MATLTITTTAPQDARVAPAFGAHLNLGRNATAPEVKAAVIAWVSRIVLQYEIEKIAQDNPPADFTPT